MNKKDYIKNVLKDYNSRYNTSFELSEKYQLFPKGGEWGYNDEWPGNGHAGVYIVMSENDELLYVGESDSMGRRLNEHFPPKDYASKFKETWSGNPSYLYVILAPDNAKHERLSLEEYLIQKLAPSLNK